jgi:Ca-activated chloride channel homolog
MKLLRSDCLRRLPRPSTLRMNTAWMPGFLLSFLLIPFAFGQATAPAQPQAAPATQTQQSAPSNSTQPAPAQSSGTTQPGQNGENGQFTIQTNVNEVNLIFTVTDRHGHFIQNLQQKDFALLDNQRAPAEIFSFSQQTNLPLRVGILVDASTSIRQRFDFEQNAAVQFLQQILRPKEDKAFVMGFDVTAYVTQPYTSDQDLLEAGITKLRPGGGTALYDAVYTACRDQLLNVPNTLAGTVRKALIIISDGDDNQSHAYPDDAIKMCQRAQTILYTISTNTSPTRDRGDEVLSKMAEDTGGTAFFPKRLEDMTNSFRGIEDELRSQYSLVYRPADFQQNGSFRSIYLVALDRKYLVRASKGYFATK